jgi:phosphonate transport system substrate-binding protein
MSLIRKRVTALGRTLAVLSLALLSPIVHAQTFTFTAIPDQDESRLTERFGRVADYLSQQLGTPVKYIPVKSYPAAVAAFRNNQVQLAWFGGLSGVQARKLVPGSDAIAQGAEDTAFKSYLIAHSSTGLKPGARLSDAIAGKSFTFGSKGSTSGRLMPEFFIREHFNKAPEAIFSRVGFSGDHSRTIALVQSGAYDLGVLNYAVWDEELKQGLIDTGKVQVIWETPTYPDYQWSIRGDVEATWGKGFKEKVTKALLEMKDPVLLQAFPRSAFVPASNSDYEPIEKTAVSLGIMDDIM